MKDSSVQHMKRIASAAILALATVPAPLLAQDGDTFASVPEPPKPEARANPAQDPKWHNQQMLALAALRWQDGWRVLPGNLRWRPISGDGSGQHPLVSDVIALHYEGKLVDGTVFDSSYGGRPVSSSLPGRRLFRRWA